MTTALRCFHCGLPVTEPGRWLAAVEGEPREMCCAGCKAVAEAIVAGGLEDYYRTRTELPPGAAGVPADLEKLRLYDEADIQARFVREGGGETCEATLLVEGMNCGACVWLLEQTLRAQPGVRDASVNLATERATLRWDPSQARLSALLESVARIGYTALPFDARQREAQIQRTSKALFRRFFVAGIGMMQVMMYAVPVYVAGPGEIDWEYENLMRWASLLLTLPVVFYSATPFLSGAWRDLRLRSPGMDVPVSIGIVAAFAASVWATVAQRGEVYFDSVTMFVFLLLGARYLEWVARRRASRAVDAMSAGLPEAVHLLDPDSGQTALVPATRVRPGDLFRVSVGERIAVDAAVHEGETAIDQSLITGESLPVRRVAGDAVPGGAINAGNPVVMRALRTSADSAISTIERLVERAAADKPRLVGITDRVARRFVVGLLAFALAVWIAWMLVDPARAWPIAIAVLVVSCPCALSMATPAALAAATGAAMRRGMLIGRGDAFERIAEATDVVFDKTGTLTVGQPELLALEPAPARVAGEAPEALRARLLSVALALEVGQSHPLAEAIRRAAAGAGIGDPAGAAADVVSHAGLGVEGTVDGRRYRLGSSAFAAQWEGRGAAGRSDAAAAAAPEPASAGPKTRSAAGASGLPAAAEESADTLAWLADSDGPLALLRFRDRLRPEAREVVQGLAGAGLRVHLLSGDRPAAAAAIAAELGIERVEAGATPERKLGYVRDLQASGARVAMVGDGVNDAPVLAAADVSVAVGKATALARTAAGVVLLGSSLNDLVGLRGLALRTRRIVAENLGWAMLYNLVAIPAAAFGWVPPWLAAIGMSVSSLIVVANALRLIPAAPAATRGALPGAQPAAPAGPRAER